MAMHKRDITQETLKKLLHYEPQTGVFTWLLRPIETIDGGKYSAERVQALMQSRDAGKEAGSFDKKGYRRIFMLGFSYPASSLAVLYMTGVYPEELVDHENLDKGDNRWVNLREATHKQNAQNKRVRRDSTTGLKGVKPHQGRFQSRIVDGHGKRRSLGLFDCAAAAHLAYVVAADIHHHEFARAQ